MIGFKYDTHVHTKETSACAGTQGKQHALVFKAKGYDGIIITDHFFEGSCRIDLSLPWEEKVNQFCLGYENAHKEGLDIGLDVFFGFEASFNGADLLTYGIDKEFLINHEEIMTFVHNRDVKGYCDFIHENGGYIVHAHPFREAAYIPQITLFPHFVDAVETFNSSHKVPEYNERAQYYAKSYGLPVTAGTDTHDHFKSTVYAGVTVDHILTSINDYCECVRQNELQIFKSLD